MKHLLYTSVYFISVIFIYSFYWFFLRFLITRILFTVFRRWRLGDRCINERILTIGKIEEEKRAWKDDAPYSKFNEASNVYGFSFCQRNENEPDTVRVIENVEPSRAHLLRDSTYIGAKKKTTIYALFFFLVNFRFYIYFFFSYHWHENRKAIRQVKWWRSLNDAGIPSFSIYIYIYCTYGEWKKMTYQ